MNQQQQDITGSIELDEQGWAMWRVFGVFFACALIAVLCSYASHAVNERERVASPELTTASGDRPSGAATPGAATNTPTTPAGPASRRPAGVYASQRGH